jgi:hypothetical protein
LLHVLLHASSVLTLTWLITILSIRFFSQTKYPSFQRQLNLYGFSRFSHGEDKGAYFHHCFVRGKRSLVRGMVRRKIKGTKVRRTMSPSEEPNFYAPEWNQQTTEPKKTKTIVDAPEVTDTALAKPVSTIIEDDSSGTPLLSPGKIQKEFKTPAVFDGGLAATRDSDFLSDGDLVLLESSPLFMLDSLEDDTEVNRDSCHDTVYSLFTPAHSHANGSSNFPMFAV